jgi:hypothetical protein
MRCGIVHNEWNGRLFVFESSPKLTHINLLLSFSLAMITKLPGSGSYKTFAYNVSLLKEFVQDDDGPTGTSRHTTRSARHKRRGSGIGNGGSLRGSFRSFRGSTLFGNKKNKDPNTMDGSIHSAGSGITSSTNGGADLFKEWKSGGMKNPRQQGKLGKAQSESIVSKNVSQK